MTRRIIVQEYVGPAEPIGDIDAEEDSLAVYDQFILRPRPKPYDRRGR
jgi:hypothetical protein